MYSSFDDIDSRKHNIHRFRRDEYCFNSRMRRKETMNKPTTVSATQKILDFLKTGHGLTPQQARKDFGIKNVSARVSELRSAGYAVYLTKRTTKGKKIVAYRLGQPSRRMVSIANLVLANPRKYASVLNEADTRLTSSTNIKPRPRFRSKAR